MEPKFTGRGGQHRADDADVAASMDELKASDAFLTSLSRGVDPADGSDELATLFLQLREEVEAPMPAAPEIPGVSGVSIDTQSSAATEEFPGVASLGKHRAKRGRHETERSGRAHRFRTNPWLAGVVGAAAATVMVAGTGTALYNATPGSALWGPSEAVFGDRTNSVEFASALDEIDSMTQSGDIAGARVLIDQLRESMNQDRSERAKRPQRDGAAPAAPNGQATVTVSHTLQPEEKPAAPEHPATVTVTPAPVTQTVTVTETAPVQGGRGADSSSSVNAPSTTSTIPTTTKVLGTPQATQAENQSS